MMRTWLREALWTVRCWLDVIGWLCWGAWWASRDELREECEGGAR